MARRMILSIDVDHFPGSEVGIDRILDVLNQRDIKAMFFIAGKFAKEYEEVIKKIHSLSHEIGSHGYSHGLDIKENFIDLDYEEQKKRIKMSSDIITEITGQRVKIFRAPYAMVSANTLKALEDLGYECDSSVSSLRFDFGMGMANNIRAFFAPTKPYHPSNNNIYKKGDSKVLEIPISAFIAPLTLSGIRTFGMKNVSYLYNMSSCFFDPVVFYLHPYEVMEMDEIRLWDGLPKRHKKNRGKIALLGLERFLDYVQSKTEFVLFKDILNGGNNDKNNL
jgi:peptidoglycan/xylan/chitin deacetylase (PgdA/CDA1 family)